MKLFEPLVVRGMALRNRIVMPPMLVGVGYRGQRARSYYGERAKGGATAITVAGTSVDLFVSDEAWGRPGGVAAFAEGARLLTETVHQAGAKIGVQLWYGNRFPAGAGEADGRGVAVAPSPRGEMRALTISEIEEIISRFARGATQAREIGFDYAEVHGAHGYLFCQFFSPADNHRNDKYGGDLAGRMRLGVECVRAMRQAVGEHYPLFFRLGAWEDRPGGITIEDSTKFAVELERAGVDVLDISVGATSQPGSAVASGPGQPEGTLVPYAAAIKEKVGVPVIAVGRIKTSAFAESILTQGKADLIAIGRQLIADPFWPQKVAEGKEDEIVPCISCNVCMDTGPRGSGLRCSVNASVTRESEYQIKAAEKSRKVIVVGGGPAGMEAARVAAQRGHKVTLYEKKDKLGGQLLTATMATYKDEIANFTRYLANQLDKAGIKVKLGTEATAGLIKRGKPEAVIIATGATPIVPGDIPGVGGKNVIGALDVLSEAKETGQRVVVIGGGMVGCETAEFLAQKGRRVTILEMLDEIGSDIGVSTRQTVLYRLRNAGIEMVTKARAEEITERGVRATQNNAIRFFEADTVVLAVGFTPNTGLAQKLAGKVSAMYSIGDCVEPRKIVDAIGDGARVGREV
jgi:2,4-dienoyl-CoA reductase-like NADH-dependent reductase (Old Yellow Enzyme family)/thioredoxin reductase